MRDFASCFSEHAVKVSDSSCRQSITRGSKSSVIASAVDFSVQASITNVYRAQLISSQKEDLLVKSTWSRTHVGPALSLGVDVDPYAHHWNPASIDSQLLRKTKGTRSFVSGTSLIALHWDYSMAKFPSGPEPLSNFYVVVIVDSEIALLLGDLSKDYVKRLEGVIHAAEFSLVSRREQVLGCSVYSAKARFSEQGKEHDIVIRCRGDNSIWADEDEDESELVVSIDKRRVFREKKLHWKFRGNQTIFVDGWPVDMMWDVKDWWFSSPQGYAVFMFRKRSALESRLWLEEELLHRERGISGFSLLIQAFKSP